MRKLLDHKFLSWLLLAVILTATVHGVCESAHAMQSPPSAASDRLSHAATLSSDDCPCSPAGQNQDFDACDSCVNCICHTSLTSDLFQLNYVPVTVELKMAHPFTYLPEVYLPKFIPPQNPA